MSERIYDVIVVGAGPAGSASAYTLAKSGADVLLLDRFSFPRDKRCGDAIMPPALEELRLLGLTELMQRFSEVRSVQTSYAGHLFSTTEVEEGGAPGKALVAPRKAFDDLLRLHAIQARAQWRSGITIHSLEGGDSDCTRLVGVDTSHQPVTLRARLVIAADGAGSRLAEQLRKRVANGAGREALTKPGSNATRLTAVRGYYRGIVRARDTLQFFFGEDEGVHYFWIFPVGDNVVNVGVIAYHDQLRQKPTDLKRALDLFLARPHVADRTRTLIGTLGAAPILAGMRGTALYGDRLLVVGDAAAMVDPTSAEGISGALASGRMAATTALEAFRGGSMTHEALRAYAIQLRQRYEESYEQRIREHVVLSKG